MKIDFYMDFTCPWCYIGLKRLQQTLAKHRDTSFEVDFLGYRLRADIDEKGISYRRNLERMINDPQQVEDNLRRITTIGSELSIGFRFDKDLITSNTQNAHRLLKFCPYDKKMTLVERLFEGVFCDAVNLGDIALLADIGEKAGVGNRLALRNFLSSDNKLPEVTADFASSAEAPIITIPYVVIDRKFPVQAVHLPLVISACIGGML